MKILYVNHYAGAPELGMEYRPYYLAREWVAAGHQVWIVAADQSHLRQKTVKPGTEEIDGIKYLWLKTPSYSGNGIKRAWNMWSFCRGVAGLSDWVREVVRPDIVIASSTYPMDIWPCRALARATGARLIWEVHDLWPLSPMELGGMPRWHPFIQWVQRAEDAACRSADAVVSMLPAADRHLVMRGMDPGRFFYVPNGICVADWEKQTSPLPEQHRALFARLKAEGRWIVGYAGAHGVANSLQSVIEAFGLLKDTPASLVLVGQGQEKEALIGYAGSISDAIHFLPSVGKLEIPALLKECDALYIGLQRQPLFRFGVSPNKLMDYAMAARPIIHAIEAANDMVADAGCGISVTPEDPGAIADAVRQLMRLSPAERSGMGQRGRAYVTTLHDYKVLAASFLRIMQKLKAAQEV